MALIRGKHTYGNPILRGEKSNVLTGNFCSISDFSTFDCGYQHNVNFITTFPLNQKLPGLERIKSQPKTKGDIILGHDVWVCEGATIMSGIKIGNGAIIGAGAVVTKDVLPYEIVGGVPAKCIGHRFNGDVEIIRKMNQISWWEWPDKKIIENAELLMSPNINVFIEKFSNKILTKQK